MKRMKRPAIDAAHHKMAPQYERLGSMISATLKALLKREGIKYFDIPYRVKTRQSTHDKFKKKGYSDFSRLTDFLGLRVIVYRESDLKVVEDLLTRSSLGDMGEEDRQLDDDLDAVLGDDERARRVRIRCPKCAWKPGKHDKWYCRCGTSWNTFMTRGVLPGVRPCVEGPCPEL